MIQGLFNDGSLPALERMVQFTEQRHKVLVNNVANLSNPYFKARDLDPRAFQQTLADAVDRRRGTPTGDGELEMDDTGELGFHQDGIVARPSEVNDTILRHDQNNIDLERNMQRLAENTLAHNAAIELIRTQFALLQTAIRERV